MKIDTKKSAILTRTIFPSALDVLANDSVRDEGTIISVHKSCSVVPINDVNVQIANILLRYAITTEDIAKLTTSGATIINYENKPSLSIRLVHENNNWQIQVAEWVSGWLGGSYGEHKTAICYSSYSAPSALFSVNESSVKVVIFRSVAEELEARISNGEIRRIN
jgi:hypothetical protein